MDETRVAAHPRREEPEEAAAGVGADAAASGGTGHAVSLLLGEDLPSDI